MDVENITEDMIMENIWSRSIMLFSKDEREIIRNSRVCIIGVGGTGGICSETLVRSGVGNIILVDPDEFELSNLNRQHFCTISKIGQKKALVAKDRLLDINPYLTVSVFPQGINKDNAEEIISNMDVIIDASDNKSAHYPLHRIAKKLEIPVISRSHRVPDMLFGAKINLWNYKKEKIETRELSENSPTAMYELEEIDDSLFSQKDNSVHAEFNEIFKKIISSSYSEKLLFSEKGSVDHYKEILLRDKIVQTTNWGPVVNITGIFLAIVAIGIVLNLEDIFLGPISVKPHIHLPICINQSEIL